MVGLGYNSSGMSPIHPATRAAAIAALDEFLPRVPVYSAARSFVRPNYHEVSRLSPYIRRRMLTEQEVVCRVLETFPFKAAEKFIQEVVWRTYWKGRLEREPWLWGDCISAEARLHNDQERAAWGKVYADACKGTTKLPYFNAWVRELIETGYLHNHVRMWFASIWIFTFKIPWQLGAMFMFRNLLDGDPASNTLSWRWVAGLQTKGKLYLAQPDNIAKYSEGRWVPGSDELCSVANAVQEAGIEAQVKGQEETDRLQFSRPSQDSYGVLTTPDDLAVTDQADLLQRATSICILAAPAQLGESELVQRFTSEAVEDAAVRFARETKMNTAVAQSPDQVQEWAVAAQLSHVVCLAPAVGPYREPMERVNLALSAAKVSVEAYHREWDAVLFGLADKGFFPFWERVKKRIERGELLFRGKFMGK